MPHFSTENIEDYIPLAPKPSLFTRIKNAIKNFLGIAPNPEIISAPEPYDLVRKPIEYLPVINNNPLQGEINKAILAARGNTHPEGLSEADINLVIKYLTPVEMKPGDLLKVGNNESISYAEFTKVAQNVENVSSKDATFKTMPRIFIYPDVPSGNSREEIILNKLNIAPDNVAYSYSDSILISQDFSNRNNREGIISAFAHEYGHRLNFATQGIVTAEYNPSKHAQVIGNDINKMYEERQSIKSVIDLKNKELARQEEKIADDYAALAGYGEGIKKFAANNLLPPSETSKHPSSKERMENIESAQNNPQSALKKIERSLDKFKKQIFSHPAETHQQLVASQASDSTYQPSR